MTYKGVKTMTTKEWFINELQKMSDEDFYALLAVIAIIDIDNAKVVLGNETIEEAVKMLAEEVEESNEQ
jgi:hypothetical protein